ncbi:fumarate reductase [Pasteurellaceae bacterium LFhippo2]|nr:fumarate reductase [Pasteurellaceae bacterium LFhippo2]
MDKLNPKRSNEPSVWLLFGAGGAVSAIFFPVLILILGFLLPFGLVTPDNIVAFAGTFIGKLAILALLIFPMWCAIHRIHLGLHDFKVHVPAGGWIFYGLAGLYSVLVLFAVIAL